MSTLRKKFITVLAVLICALLVLSTALIIPKNQTAEAGTSTNQVADLVVLNSSNSPQLDGAGNLQFNYTNLKTLFGKLTKNISGTETKTYTAVEKLFTTVTTANNAFNAAQIAGEAVTPDGIPSAPTTTTKKTYIDEFTVKFGNIEWEPLYLSTDKKGNVILTLWQAANTADVVSWNTWSGDPTTNTLPCTMYSVSQTRSRLMGTNYANTPNQTSPQGSGASVQSDQWRNFISNYKKCIVTPADVEWQEHETVRKYIMARKENVFYDYDVPNEAWGVPYNGSGVGLSSDRQNIKWDSTFIANVYNNTLTNAKNVRYYTEWKDDQLWCPSWSEVGGLTHYSMWNPSYNQLLNPNGYMSWIRSAHGTAYWSVDYVDAQSELQRLESKIVSQVITARPAFHLNLTKMMELSPSDITTTYTGSALTVAGIYGSNSASVPWYKSAIYPDNVGYTYTLDGSEKPVLNVGTYKATLKFNANNTMGYRWANPNADDKSATTINIEVKKKPVKVRFTGAGGIISDGYVVSTSADGKNYPVAEYLNGEIASNDAAGGANDANYPTLVVKYRDSAGAPCDATPTKAGHYKAIAEITATNSNYELHAEEDGYKNYIDFVIKPEVVAQPSLSHGTNLTYDSTGHTIDIVNYSSHIKYTVKKDGVIMTDKENLTDESFEVIDAGTYTVTFAIVDSDKPSYAWDDSVGANDSLNNAPFDATPFTVQQAELNITYEGFNNPDSVNFSGGAWGVSTQVKFKVSVTGEVSGESVKLYLTYSDKDGNDKKPVGVQDDYYIIPAISAKGDYKLLCELADSTAYPVNANYKIKSGAEKGFKVTNSTIDIGNITWFYVNSQLGSGTPQAFGDKNEVRYNGSAYTLTIDTNLPDHVIIDTSKGNKGYSNNVQTNYSAGEYTTTVYLTTNDSNYELSKTSFEIKWKILQGLYDLSGVTWSYTVPFTYDPVNHTTYSVSLIIPDDLKAKGLSYAWSQDGSDNSSSVAGTFTAKIILTTSDDNYVRPVKGQPDTYIYSGDKGFPWELEWVVEKYTQNFEWQTGSKGTLTENSKNESFYLPKVIDPDGMVTVKYYKKGDFDDNTKQPVAGAQPVDPDDMIVATSSAQAEAEGTYYAVLEFVGQYASNYKFGTGAYVKFNTFDTRQTLVVSISKAEYDYDGNPHADFATEVTILYATQSDIANYIVYEYFKVPANGGAPVSLGTTAPKNAGTYKIKISLNEAGGAIFVISGDSEFEYEIKTLVLDIPEFDGTLTYDGTDRDVGALVGIPDGWENYIEVKIRLGTENVSGNTIKAVGKYTVTFTFKSGVNANDGSANNVEWNTNIIAAKTASQSVSIEIKQLELHAKEWYENGYYSRVEFTEGSVEQFLTYKVYDVDGNEVDENTVYSSVGEMFVVKVSVGEEHGDNVIIKFESGISDEFEFYTDGGEEPVQVTLPTIGDLTFNGKDQTFAVDYGGFEDYIEIDTSLSNPSVLVQFNADEYEIYFKIKRGVNAVWADTGGRESIAVTFKMKELVLDDPKIDANQKFTYNGSEITAILNIDGAILARFLEVEGDISAVNAGKYTFTLAIKESFAGNVVWASEGEKKVDWTIEKAKIEVKWKDGKVPELNLPDGFTNLEVEYIFTDADGKKVERDGLADGKYTVTAKLKDESNFEFVDDSGKVLANPAMTEGYEFEYVEDDLANERRAAREELEKSAAAKYEEIEKSDMSDEEKAAARAEVDAELAKGLENIAGAKDESELNSVTSTSKTKIEEIKVVGGSPFPWWIIALIAGALIAAVAVIIIVVKKRQTADGDDDFADFYDDEYDYDEEEEIDDFDDGDDF